MRCWRRSATSGPTVLHLCGERYYETLRGRVARDGYHLLPWTDDFGAALAATDLVLARAGGSVWEVAAAGKPAVLVPSPNVDRRPPDEERALLRRGAAARVVVPEARALARSGPRPLAARRPGAAGRDGCGDAPHRAAGRCRRDRGGAPRTCLRAAGSGSSGSAAPGSRPTRCSRVPGAPRSAAGTATRRRIWSACAPAESRSTVSPEPEAPEGWEAIVSSAYPSFPGTPRAELLAELVSLRRSIVVAGAHGKTTTTGMIAFALAETRARPGVARGRRDAAARRQRAARGKAGSSSRVTSPTARSSGSGRRSRSSRTSSSTITRPSRRRAEVEELFERWLAEVPARRARLGARAGGVPARRPGRAQPR